MNKRRNLRNLVFAALLLFPSVAQLQGYDHPLRYGDVGIYGTRWQDWIAQGSAHVDFTIYQVAPTSDPGVVMKAIENANGRGTRILLDMIFYENDGQRVNRRDAPALKNLDYYEGLYARILDKLNGRRIEGVTLDEETVIDPPRKQFLTDLYLHLKQLYPDIKFYQWHTAFVRRGVPDEVNWPSLPADGWIIDPYAIPDNDYDQYISGLMRFGKPIISVIWLSPNWHADGVGNQAIDSRWWNTVGWRNFYTRMAITQKYGVPTIFYAFDKTRDSGEQLPSWMSKDPCDTKFVNDFFASTASYIRSGHKMPMPPPAKRPGWIPGFCGD